MSEPKCADSYMVDDQAGEERHVHVWTNFPHATFYCEAEDACPLQMSATDVAKRLNFWMRLEQEDWERRVGK